MILFVDIETLPASVELEPVLRELYERRPGRSRTFDDYTRGTSLNPNWGQILCIGTALDEEAATIISGTESEMLASFWTKAQAATRIVGHNLIDFDLLFLWKRSVIQHVKPTRSKQELSGEQIYDTMKEWACLPAGRGGGAYSYTGLHELAKIFGLESSKQGIDGSMIYDAYRAGRVQEIHDYCKRDVELTRQVYRRLTFQEV